MKMCKRCGAANGDSGKFCVECGAPLESRSNRNGGAQGQSRGNMYGGAQGQSRGNMYGGAQGEDFYGGYSDRGPDRSANAQEEIIYTDVAPRSIAVSVILTIVTCGIYFFYWMYHLNNEINEMAQEPMATGGGTVVVLSLVTCGIYTLYWYYKMGERCDYIAQTHTSNNVLYLILGIFGLGIVSVALMQDTVNRALS